MADEANKVRGNKDKVVVDPMNLVFAKVMHIVTIVALILIIVPGIAYFAEINQYISVDVVTHHWDEVAEYFWKDIRGYNIRGYSWFLSNLGYSDNISVLGVALLATTPFISIIATISRSKKLYAIIFIVLIIEFTLAVLRPLL